MQKRRLRESSKCLRHGDGQDHRGDQSAGTEKCRMPWHGNDAHPPRCRSMWLRTRNIVELMFFLFGLTRVKRITGPDIAGRAIGNGKC